MRDPARIARILAKIEGIWRTAPDLRLGQLLANCDRRMEHRLFYYEDDDLEKALDRFTLTVAKGHE